MAVTRGSIVVVSSEVITAFDRGTGGVLWSSGMSATSGPTWVIVTPDGVVVVAPQYEDVQAFDLETGDPMPVPAGIDIPDEPEWSHSLPAGYTFEGGSLCYQERVIWSGPTTADPSIARVGDLTVINDFENGLRIVGDDGTVLAAPELGAREYDEGSVFVDGDVAVTVTSDGVLYAISSARQ